MTKVVAIMSISRRVHRDVDDVVAEVFDWYVTSENVEIHAGGSNPMTFKEAS